MMPKSLKPQLVIQERCEDDETPISMTWKRRRGVELPRLPYSITKTQVESLVGHLKTEYDFEVVDLRVRDKAIELGLVPLQWRHFWGSVENSKFTPVHLIQTTRFIDGSLNSEKALCGKENNGRQVTQEPIGTFCKVCAKAALKMAKSKVKDASP